MSSMTVAAIAWPGLEQLDMQRQPDPVQDSVVFQEANCLHLTRLNIDCTTKKHPSWLIGWQRGGGGEKLHAFASQSWLITELTHLQIGLLSELRHKPAGPVGRVVFIEGAWFNCSAKLFRMRAKGSVSTRQLHALLHLCGARLTLCASCAIIQPIKTFTKPVTGQISASLSF